MLFVIYILVGIIVGFFMAWIIYELKIKDKKIRRVDAIIKDILSLNSYTKKVGLKKKYNVKEDDSRRIILNEIIVANSGNLSVKNQEMVVKFAESTRIIDCKITRKPELGFEKISHNYLENNLMVIKFENLNPNDNAIVKITTYDKSNGDFKIYLRSEDVETRIFDYHTEVRAISEFFSKTDSEISFWNVIFSLPKLLHLVNILKKYRIA